MSFDNTFILYSVWQFTLQDLHNVVDGLAPIKTFLSPWNLPVNLQQSHQIIVYCTSLCLLLCCWSSMIHPMAIFRYCVMLQLHRWARW